MLLGFPNAELPGPEPNTDGLFSLEPPNAKAALLSAWPNAGGLVAPKVLEEVVVPPKTELLPNTELE